MPQPQAPETADTSALVALGGNLAGPHGGPAATLRAALTALAAEFGPLTASRIWTSPAYPPGAGPDYANAACSFRTAAPPEEILARLHTIEAGFGRQRATRWGARVLDLDLLALGDLVRPDPAGWRLWRDLPVADQTRLTPGQLILPHPRLQDRGFVLEPLAEIAPDWRHPVTGATVAQMRAALPAEAVDGLVPLT